MTKEPFDPMPRASAEPISHQPFDYEEYFTRLGEGYVARAQMNRRFDARTAAAADVWLAYRSRQKAEQDRVRTAVLAVLSVAATMATVVATALWH